MLCYGFTFKKKQARVKLLFKYKAELGKMARQAKHAGKVADADKDTSSGAPQAAQTKKKKWGLFG